MIQGLCSKNMKILFFLLKIPNIKSTYVFVEVKTELKIENVIVSTVVNNLKYILLNIITDQDNFKPSPYQPVQTICVHLLKQHLI